MPRKSKIKHIQYCSCGCANLAPPGNRFIHGHNRRTPSIDDDKRNAHPKEHAAFRGHKKRARQRKIAFELTFIEWLQIWVSSRRFAQRGWKPGQYVMARFGDVGPYAVGNVEIIRADDNLHQPQVKAKNAIAAGTPAKRALISRLFKNKPLSPAHRAKIREAKLQYHAKQRAQQGEK